MFAIYCILFIGRPISSHLLHKETTSTTASSSVPLPSQPTFEVGDMVCIKGAGKKGGGVVRWVGIFNGDQTAGIEMVSKS